jgi:hypothetical protein
LHTIAEITKEERYDLREWVAAGNSVYDNPYSIYDDSGQPMDFINGCRFEAEMTEEQFRSLDIEPEDIDDGDWDDELPF